MPEGGFTADDTLSALAHAKLRPSERRVAAIVAERRRDVPRMSIAELAREAGVSEPTVHRFCRALGCEGFPAFKLRLAEGLASVGLAGGTSALKSAAMSGAKVIAQETNPMRQNVVATKFPGEKPVLPSLPR